MFTSQIIYTLSQDAQRECAPAKEVNKEEMASRKLGMKYRQEAKGTPRMTMKECTMVVPIHKTYRDQPYRLVHEDWGLRKKDECRLSYVSLQKNSPRSRWRVRKQLGISTWKTKQIKTRKFWNARKTRGCIVKVTKF